MRSASWVTTFVLLVACGGDLAAPTRGDTTAVRARGDVDAATPRLADEMAIGTAHPAFVRGADPERRWVVLCQARRETDGRDGIAVYSDAHGALSGDELVPYLVHGAGDGEPIDDFIGSDASGRWVLFARGEAVELLDVTTMQTTALGPMPVEHANALAQHPAFDFEAGRLARVDTSGAVLVRELATGHETRVDPGSGLVVRVAFERGAEALSVLVVPHDTDGDGRLAAPVPHTTADASGPCDEYVTFVPPGLAMIGDRTERRIARIGDGTAVDHVIARADGGAILLDDDGADAPTELAPSGSQDASTTLIPRGRFVVVDSLVLDVDRAVSVGSIHGYVHAVSTDGRVLVSAEQHRGPLAWRAPMPVGTTPEVWQAAGAQ